MIEQLIGEITIGFDWVVSKLGWEGIPLTWVHYLLLGLAVVGALMMIRNLLGGGAGGGGGGSSAAVYPQSSRTAGLPTSAYTSSPKLSDFSIKPEVYDFRPPTPTPDLSPLRGPVGLDMEKARKMFLVNSVKGPQVEENSSQEGRSTDAPPPPTGPDWELARRLFIPGSGKKGD